MSLSMVFGLYSKVMAAYIAVYKVTFFLIYKNTTIRGENENNYTPEQFTVKNDKDEKKKKFLLLYNSL